MTIHKLLIMNLLNQNQVELVTLMKSKDLFMEHLILDFGCLGNTLILLKDKRFPILHFFHGIV